MKDRGLLELRSINTMIHLGTRCTFWATIAPELEPSDFALLLVPKEEVKYN
jgi:hypothetical protein